MPLIQSHRHSKDDLAAWGRFHELAAIHSRLRSYRERVTRSIDVLRAFVESGPCYAGVSWGKDSTALAHLVTSSRLPVPLVWVRVSEDFNPDCLLVRDAFLSSNDAVYHELEFPVSRVRGARYLSEAASGAHGTRYLSGVRADESPARRQRHMRWGETTINTCAPMSRWSGLDVFSYLIEHELPIHPAYACTFGGSLDPCRIRVSALGGIAGTRAGDGMGRAEWERRYYRDELIAIERSST